MTDTAENRYTIAHRADESRYVLLDLGERSAAEGGAGGSASGETAAKEIGLEAYVDHTSEGKTARIMYHTVVDEAYGGQGLAGRLVHFAVEHAIGEGLAVVPVCPYVAAWLKKHPEYSEHVIEPGREHLRAVRASQG